MVGRGGNRSNDQKMVLLGRGGNSSNNQRMGKWRQGLIQKIFIGYDD